VTVKAADDFRVRPTRPTDFEAIVDLCLRVYPHSKPWGSSQLASHLEVFPAGQLVAEERATSFLAGMSASLIVRWDDYEVGESWRDFTDTGMFTNHDPRGRTLYGAEVMVHPDTRGLGIGKLLYQERRRLVRRLRLLRIRAGARIRGYHRVAGRMSPEEYVRRVVNRELGDPTLSFQLKQGFRVIAVIPGYLPGDPESLGWAAVIEWINHEVAKPRDWAGRRGIFTRQRKP
jgi:ribosomal protein S18 acetylase RimI-like enzyme